MPAEPFTPAVLNNSHGTSRETVRVVIQARPLLPFESAQGAVSALYAQSDPPCVTVRRKSGAADASFHSFDAVYPPIPDALPDLLYESHVTPLLTSVFSGLNATVFAYGQTSAGKSYTMRHITNRVANDLFTLKAQIEQQRPVHVSIRISFVEVYKDTIRDLVDGASAPLATVHVHVRERITSTGRVVFLDGAKERVVDSEQDLLAIIKEAALVRRTAATGMNASSSRSHSIITLSIIQESLEDSNLSSSSATTPANASKILSAKLHLVDLAGSERAKRTAAAGERFAEGVQINCGLFALSKVISVLAQNSGKPKSKHRHVPYRDSKLTRLLQDSLGGNARTLLIACVSPADSSVEESLGTLRYAQCAKRICNKPKVNTDPAAVEVSDLRAALSRARAQISALVAENERLRAHVKSAARLSSVNRPNISPRPAATIDSRTPQTACASSHFPVRSHGLASDEGDGSDTTDSPKQSRRAPTLYTTRSLPKFTTCATPSTMSRIRRPLSPRLRNMSRNKASHVLCESDAERKENVPVLPLQASVSGCADDQLYTAKLSSMPKRAKSSRAGLLPGSTSASDRSDPFGTNAARKRARSAAPPRRTTTVASREVRMPKRAGVGKAIRNSPVLAVTHRSAVKSSKGSGMRRAVQSQKRGSHRGDSESPGDSGYFDEEADSEEDNDTDTDANDNAGLGRHVMSALSEARVEQMRKTFTERLEQAESDKAVLDRERSRLLQEITALREKHSREIEDLKSSHISKTAAFRAKLAGVKRLEAESVRQSKLREGSDAARKRMQGRVTAAQKAKDQAVERMSDMLARAENVNCGLDRENRKLSKSERSLRHEIQKLVDDMARVESANAKLRGENESLRGRLRTVMREPGLRRANSTVVSSAHVRAAAV